MGRVTHFEIDADDPARAAKFYREALGWEVTKWGGPINYWLATTGPADKGGINGGIQPAGSGFGRPGFTCVVDVANLDESLAKVVAAGGVVVRPKHAVPGVGWFAYARDTEGNVFGMGQDDRNAK